MLFYKVFVRDTLADDKLRLLGYEGIGVREILLCYIANSPVMNHLYRNEIEPYHDTEIAKLLSLELQTWLHIKDRLFKYGGMVIDDKKAIGFPKFSERQSDYYRQKRYRVSRKKVTALVTKELRTEVRSKKLEVRSKNKEYGTRALFLKPQPDEVTAYAKSIGFDLDGKYFCDKNDAIGWVVGKNRTPMKDWQAVVRTWFSRQKESQPTAKPSPIQTIDQSECDKLFNREAVHDKP